MCIKKYNTHTFIYIYIYLYVYIEIYNSGIIQIVVTPPFCNEHE